MGRLRNRYKFDHTAEYLLIYSDSSTDIIKRFFTTDREIIGWRENNSDIKKIYFAGRIISDFTNQIKNGKTT